MKQKLLFVLYVSFLFSATLAEDKEKRSTVCYGDLGCFSTGGAFTSLYRPVNLSPQSPASINARFLLFTQENSQNKAYQLLNANNFDSIQTSNFQSSRKTKVISHGFIENGFADWMMQMKDELLKFDDYNVILLDWGGGSKPPYTQATANTRVVGAELAKLIRVLMDKTSARAEDFHLIGHSLGAHICGYAGERTQNLGRISGLDPADPYFQYTDTTVRLDPSDAKFVDIMHTNGASILTLGYGMRQPCGHVDYYPNEGLNQPGCDANPVTKLLTEGDIYEGGKQIVACSHLRAHHYFTESINSRCPFNGYKCNSYADFERGLCLPCSGGNCGYMGFHADKTKPPAGKTHVKYFLDTGKVAPYCRYHYQIDVQFGQLGSKSEKGTLYMNLIGSNGQLGEHQLNTDVLEVQPGHTYGFMVTSTHDIGDLSQMTFRWELDSHWYNPLTWSLLSTHAIQIDTVDIVNGETNKKKRFCGFNAGVQNSVTRTFQDSC
ncbi:pancreatic triacylglycerol lipase-like [Mercenaria mercenaria]|uniref:pancreatic triacylglycerol lipase-like n=1 Tax=Mercenaria mercenaria TaxID=6596 RepID=UPI00234E65B8|nr:pancreatic triacylglycerol lipase-like [Mercenaria mercenaria]